MLHFWAEPKFPATHPPKRSLNTPVFMHMPGTDPKPYFSMGLDCASKHPKLKLLNPKAPTFQLPIGIGAFPLWGLATVSLEPSWRKPESLGFKLQRFQGQRSRSLGLI